MQSIHRHHVCPPESPRPNDSFGCTPNVMLHMHARPVRLWCEMLPSPLGDIALVSDGTALCALDFADFRDRMHRLLQRRYGSYEIVREAGSFTAADELRRYFEGDVAALDAVPADPGGTPYQRRVWQLLRTIRFGETRTYGEVATRLGETHARAVGAANALNPIAIVVPCHRVIGAGGALTGYAGGVARKRWLLDHEARQPALVPLSR